MADYYSVIARAVSRLPIRRCKSRVLRGFLFQRLNTNDGKHLRANMHTGGRSHKRLLQRHHSTHADVHGD